MGARFQDCASPIEDADVERTLRRTASGAGWTVGWRMTTRLLGLVNSLVLGVFLGPGDFGIVVLSTGIVASLDLVMATGVADSVVRKVDPTPAFYDSAFTLAVLKGLLLAGVVFLAAPGLAALFHDPRLSDLLRLLSLTVVCGGIESVRIFDLRRDMEFRREFVYRVWPRVVGIACTVAAVVVLRSYWALVVGIFAGRLCSIVASYVVKPHRPRLSFTHFGELLGFSSWTAATGILDMARNRADSFLLGWLMDAAAVGNYAVGFELASIPTSEVVDPLCRVCFSAFAEERRSEGRARIAFLRILSVMLLLTLPAGFGVALMAEPIIRATYGSAYLDAVPVLRLVGLSACLVVLSSVSATLFQAHGHLSSVFRLDLVGTAVRLSCLVALIPICGLTGAGLAVVASRLVEQSAYAWVCFRRFGVGFSDVFRRNWRGLFAAVAMAVVLLSLGLGHPVVVQGKGAAVLALLEGVSVGFAVYVGVLCCLWFLSGRPAGPESDAGRLLASAAVRLLRLPSSFRVAREVSPR